MEYSTAARCLGGGEGNFKDEVMDVEGFLLAWILAVGDFIIASCLAVLD